MFRNQKTNPRLTSAKLLRRILANPYFPLNSTKIVQRREGPDKVVEVRVKFYRGSFLQRLAVSKVFRRIRKTCLFAECGGHFCVWLEHHIESDRMHRLGNRIHELRISFHVNEGDYPILTPMPMYQVVDETYRWITLDAIDPFGILEPASKAA